MVRSPQKENYAYNEQQFKRNLRIMKKKKVGMEIFQNTLQPIFDRF
jgi:hypothetical protein